MKMQTVAVAAAFALAGSVAFAQDVKVDFDKDANFGAIKTFSLKIGTSWGNPLSEKRVTTEFEQALTAKGWAKTDEATADAIVTGESTLWTSIRNGLGTSIAGLLLSVRLLVIGLCLVGPWALVLWVAVRIWRRRRKSVVA